MTTTVAPNEPTPAAHGGDASRRWRSIWRFHFYSGVFAMPFIVLMALTGLVILYTQPLQDLTQGDLRTVTVSGAMRSYADQERAVERAFPDNAVTSMTVGADRHHATVFGIDDGSDSGRSVFVDPYRATVLGSQTPGDDIVGLANRLHGYLNNDAITIPLPTVSALWDDGAVMRDYVVGDLALEALGVWTLVLVCSGLFIWWPRRSVSNRSTRRRFGLRRGVTGRARWRDLHGMSGVLLFALMVLTIVSGLAWSTYWGPNFSALADRLTPNNWVETPASQLGTRGDLDRFGNQIPWNTGDKPLPASYAPKADGSLPRPLGLDEVVAVAKAEGMKPGWTVSFPENVTDEKTGTTTYGSFTVSNSWPRKTSEARDIFVDQFTGKRLAQNLVYGNGAVATGMDTLVSVHMGTQLGIIDRVLMTLLCVLSLWSVASACVMYAKRRRPGTLGLPRRPTDVRLAKGLAVILVLCAIVFPVWGITALVVVGIDHWVVQRSRARRIFGQR